MGYKEYPDTDVKEVGFGTIRIYSLQGITIQNDYEEKKSEVITLLDRCTVVIAQSVSEAFKLLTGKVFFDDEEKWLSEKKVAPPFLLIYFKESALVELKGGYRQEIDGYILTYDAFPEKNKEIREWENEVLPGIVTSLTVNLSTINKKFTTKVKLELIDRSVFGLTKDGIILFNFKLTASAVGYAPSPISIEQINASLLNSTRLLPTLTKGVCRNFYAALNEPDRMKQFLGYFQFIERYTHATYKTISFNDVKEVFNIPQCINEPVSKIFESIFSESKNLTQRFHWCAIIAWDNIGESDVNGFLQAKKVRDRLSHGEHVEDSKLSVETVKELALKILSAKKT